MEYAVDALEFHTMKTVSRRLVPFLFAMYVFNFLDRTNAALAALQMNERLGFGPAVFGFGAGIFFVAYALFEVPSNLVLARVGARRWLARIMVTWGVLAAGMLFVRTPLEFYTVRFLLGAAEAGFYPGVMLYLSRWFPGAYRARSIGSIAIAVPLAQALGGAIGGGLLKLDGAAHLAGWQWLFLVEGMPAVLLGVATLFYLTERPSDAAWLTAAQRRWLIERLDGEERALPPETASPVWAAFVNPLTWLLALPYFANFMMATAYITWAPLMIRDALGTRNTVTGFIMAAIAVLSIAFYRLAGTLSDARDERYGFAAAGLAFMIVGCLIAAVAPQPLLEIGGLALIPFGAGIFLPSFWCLPPRIGSGRTGATAVAIVSAVGASGGLFGSALIGVFKQVDGSDAGAFLILAGIGAGACILCVVLRQRRVLWQPAITTYNAPATPNSMAPPSE